MDTFKKQKAHDMKKTKSPRKAIPKKEKELFTKSMIKDLEMLFRNCDEKVAKLSFEKLVTQSPIKL